MTMEEQPRWTLIGGPLGRVYVDDGPSSLGIGEMIDVVPAPDGIVGAASGLHADTGAVVTRAEYERLREERNDLYDALYNETRPEVERLREERNALADALREAVQYVEPDAPRRRCHKVLLRWGEKCRLSR